MNERYPVTPQSLTEPTQLTLLTASSVTDQPSRLKPYSDDPNRDESGMLKQSDLAQLDDKQLERIHRGILQERDTQHNRLQYINRKLDAVRAERMRRG